GAQSASVEDDVVPTPQPVIAASVPAADNTRDVPAAPQDLSPAPAPAVNQTAPASARTDAFIRANSKFDKALSDRIKPDANLPAAIQAIEKKAFEGIPEAQHDLAAIYTAGHGGV